MGFPQGVSEAFAFVFERSSYDPPLLRQNSRPVERCFAIKNYVPGLDSQSCVTVPSFSRWAQSHASELDPREIRDRVTPATAPSFVADHASALLASSARSGWRPRIRAVLPHNAAYELDCGSRLLDAIIPCLGPDRTCMRPVVLRGVTVRQLLYLTLRTEARAVCSIKGTRGTGQDGARGSGMTWPSGQGPRASPPPTTSRRTSGFGKASLA